MKRLTLLALVVILASSTAGCRRGSSCFGLRGASCGRPVLRAPWRKPPPPQVIYQQVPVPVTCPAPQPTCDPCPPVAGPGYTVPGTTVQPYTQGYGVTDQVVPGGMIDGGVISGQQYGTVIGDRVLQPSSTAPGLETVPIDK